MEELGIIIHLGLLSNFDAITCKSLLRKINSQGDYQPFYTHTRTGDQLWWTAAPQNEKE